jgi:hypothetical protein
MPFGRTPKCNAINALRFGLPRRLHYVLPDTEYCGGEHYRTIEALEFSIDPQRKIIPQLDALRRKRNTGAYDDYGLVTKGEADLGANWRYKFAMMSRTGFARPTLTRLRENGYSIFARRALTLRDYYRSATAPRPRRIAHVSEC